MNPTRRCVGLGAIGVAFAGVAPNVRAQRAVNNVYTVPVVSQTMMNDCWVAAAAMLLSWKRQGLPPYSELEVAQQAGPNFVVSYQTDAGLLPAEVQEFAAALNLATEAPQNYTVQGYFDLISAHGPVWVGSELDVPGNPRKHVRILRGLVGDGTPDGTTAFVVDPDGGRDYTETITQFAAELEEIARDENPGGPLFPQIIRFP